MKIPQTNRPRALIVVDLQPAFIKPHNGHIVPSVASLIKQVPYDAYVEAVFRAEKGSLWDQQQDWICPLNEKTLTVETVRDLLQPLEPLQVLKETRSVFKGDQDVEGYLRERGIEEIHLVGTETNDCVFATALDAFDRGWPVYVLEECCESATEGRHDLGLQLLRFQGMTNNRCLAETLDVTI